MNESHFKSSTYVKSDKCTSQNKNSGVKPYLSQQHDKQIMLTRIHEFTILNYTMCKKMFYLLLPTSVIYK